MSEVAERIVDALRSRSWTIATGESLTAGLVASSLAEVPGCSDVLRGGVIAYQVDVKESVLGVSPQAISRGVVSEQVAVELAQGAARTLGARVGVGTTGAAGPDSHDGAPAGTVWVGVWVHGGPGEAGTVRARHIQASGDRSHVRAEATRVALEEVWAALQSRCGSCSCGMGCAVSGNKRSDDDVLPISHGVHRSPGALWWRLTRVPGRVRRHGP